MLESNRAIPEQYAQFREAVLSGHIPVNEEISMEMNRIDALIANPNFYYDKNAYEGYVRYCENELVLTDGQPLKLLDTFKLWAEQLFGWYYYETRTAYVPGINGAPGRYTQIKKRKRLIKKQYIIVARGGAKSMYGSTVQSYGLNVDTDTTHGITTSPTMKQSDEIVSPIKTSILRARGPLMQFLTQGSINNTTGSKANRVKIASTKKGIENFLTGSIVEIRPMRIDKLQGLRTKYATVDEWLSGDTREDVIGAIEQGASKLDDYIILAMSSEGTIRNSVGDSIKMELLSILKGEYYAPHISIWYYKLDSIEEVANPDMWIKAQPNIGQTVSYETYALDVERAEKVPSTRNDILAKRFGIPMEGYTYYFTYEDTLVHQPRQYWNMQCAMGIDLSQGDDFCAFTFLFPLPRGEFGIKSLCFITERTMGRLPIALRTKYQEFLEEGSLYVINQSILDIMDVYDEVEKYINENAYDVCCVGYDPYNAKEFINRWVTEHSPYGVDKVIQGAKTETVPLGELKTLFEDRIAIFDQAIFSYNMGNVITLEDTNGNRKLLKKRSQNKIDCVAALLDAFVSYKLNKELFD